jgi:hypothetical protein
MKTVNKSSFAAPVYSRASTLISVPAGRPSYSLSIVAVT